MQSIDHATQDGASSAGAVRVLYRGLSLLRAFEPDNNWNSNADLAAKTGLPKATVSRLTANLTSAGYLAYSPERAAYRLAASVLALGYLAHLSQDLATTARPLMQDFADQQQASVVLAALDGDAMVCQVVAHGSAMLMALRVHPGSRLDILTSALGRAMVGALPQAERSTLLERLAQRASVAPAVFERRAAIAVQEMQARRFCIATSSLQHGVNGVATTVDGPNARPVCAIGCAAPESQLDLARIESDLGPALLRLKQSIEAALSRPAVAQVA